MNPIIPEVITKDLRETKILNLNLKRVENKQTYNKYDYNNSKTINNTTINQNKGVLRLFFEMLFFPVILIYKILKHLFIKYDVAGNWKKNNEFNDRYDKNKARLKKLIKLQRLDDEMY